MPSSITHALFPALCLASSRAYLPQLSRWESLRLIVICCFLGNSPDLDLIPGILFPEHWLYFHREWGHNIFALALAIFCGKYLLQFTVQKLSSKQALSLSISMVLSHILLDSMSHFPSGEFCGVPLLWPISSWSFYIPLPLFTTTVVDPTVHPILGHATAPDFWTNVIFQEFCYSLCLVLVWMSGSSLLRYRQRRQNNKKTLGQETREA